MNDFKAAIRSIPIITRVYLIGIFITSTLLTLNVNLTYYMINFELSKIIYSFQV